MVKGMHTGMILRNPQKAFDTLAHKILLGMIYLGLKIPVTKWFASYLLNRKFFVSVNDVFSEPGIFWDHSCF